MTMVAPESIKRYSIQPKPINTIQIGANGGRGFSTLEAMEYEHPDLDINALETKWEYSVNETHVIWQAGKNWDFGVGWFSSAGERSDFGNYIPYSANWVQKSVTLSSLINHSSPDSWLQTASLHQVTLSKKGYNASINYQEWNTLAEEIRYTYSHLFASNPKGHWIEWGGGFVFTTSLLRLRSQYNDSEFKTTMKRKFYPGLRWYVGFKISDIQAGFDHLIMYPFMDEHISWYFGLSFNYKFGDKF